MAILKHGYCEQNRMPQVPFSVRTQTEYMKISFLYIISTFVFCVKARTTMMK